MIQVAGPQSAASRTRQTHRPLPEGRAVIQAESLDARATDDDCRAVRHGGQEQAVSTFALPTQCPVGEVEAMQLVGVARGEENAPLGDRGEESSQRVVSSAPV